MQGNQPGVLMHPVMVISAVIVLLLAGVGALMPAEFERLAKNLLLFTTTNFGWFYLLTVFAIVVFLFGLAVSRFGSIRLGPEGSRPEFPFFTWIAMLYSAGFGAGLVFWGVAEPMSHFFTPPFQSLEPQSAPAARVAMGYSFFHWGVSQWSVFALAGLGIGYMQFRKGRDGLVSTALEPVVGKRPGIRTAVDVLAVVATVMGVATSLGLGVLQISGGLQSVMGWAGSLKLQLLVIAVMFAVYMLSSTTGLHRGIRWLSNFNLGLCLLLLAFVFVAGPTVFILNAFTLGLGDYLSHFVEYSLRLTPYRGGTWVRDWTIFYWAWAIAWSPFVGAFVARVSRGRTIREFIFGVLIVPPMIACAWIGTFGGMALHEDLLHAAGIAAVVDKDVALALFTLYRHLPMGDLLSILSILLIFTFLVTSADSATYILAGMVSGGNPDPRQSLKVFWGAMMSLIAGVLLAAGGLASLQTASLVAALPFTGLLILLMVALVRLLRVEPLPVMQGQPPVQ
ncbi:MAG: BCCT family transporter [Burkholderiales bacterium]|nr:BCCT family transporter [Burkholderiales bacterium]MDP2398974.1 BCCT family transporter [Burkholderiales bacterium]